MWGESRFKMGSAPTSISPVERVPRIFRPALAVDLAREALMLFALLGEVVTCLALALEFAMPEFQRIAAVRFLVIAHCRRP